MLKATDTTNANGDVSVTWTLGNTIGTQSLTAKVAAAPSITTTATATAAAGAASQLVFSTQPPASSVYQTGFGFAVTAKDALGNKVTTFTGPVTVAIATNPAAGTLSGSLTQNAVAGVATFSGLSLDNIGTGYALSGSATGLTSGTSNAFNIVAPNGWNVWINRSGGNWSVPANWSKGVVPAATDTVGVNQSGTYAVSFNTSTGTFARLVVGAPLGAQTLSVDTTTATIPAGGATFGATGILALSGTGTIIGAGTVGVSGAFNWTGGNLGAIGGPAGSLQVLSGGTLSIAPATTTQLQNYSLILAGTGTWTGSAVTNTGNGGVLSVTAGGVLNVTGGSTISRNLGGSALFQNNGTVNVAPGALNSFVMNDSVAGTGAWSVQNGALNLQLAGTLGGSLTVASGATLNFFLGGSTLTFGPTSSISGAGAVAVHSGFPRFTGSYNLSGLTTLDTGSVAFAGATGTAGALTLVSGAASLIDSAGAMTFGGATTWSAGGITVLTGTLTLAGGSGASFGGSPSLNTGSLALGGGTFTLTSNLNALGTGTLQVSGGSLVLNGHTASVGGSFTTSGGGGLSMTNTADSLLVTGAATFGGSSGFLSAGVMTVGGNFSQTTAANAFAAAGSHRTILNGTGAQNISFANPTTSFFRRLELPAIAHTVTLQTNVQVTDSLTMFAGPVAATMNGAGTSQRLTIGGRLTMQIQTSSPVLTPPVVELSVAPTINGGTFSPDTTVFLPGIAALPTGGGIAYKNVRVATGSVFTAPGSNVTFNGSVIISSGTFAFTAATDSIGGFLRTEATGALSMTGTVAAPTIAVRDSAVFAGGASTSLSAGLLRIYGNFVQRGTDRSVRGHRHAGLAPEGHGRRPDHPDGRLGQQLLPRPGPQPAQCGHRADALERPGAGLRDRGRVVGPRQHEPRSAEDAGDRGGPRALGRRPQALAGRNRALGIAVGR